jgi:hypothetical protein
MTSWTDRKIKGVLLDITGALFESGAKEPIEGSVEAVQRLDYNNYHIEHTSGCIIQRLIDYNNHHTEHTSGCILIQRLDYNNHHIEHTSGCSNTEVNRL